MARGCVGKGRRKHGMGSDAKGRGLERRGPRELRHARERKEKRERARKSKVEGKRAPDVAWEEEGSAMELRG